MTRRNIGGWTVFLALASASVAAAQSSRSGPDIYTASSTHGPYALEAMSLQQMPDGYVPIKFDEPVWVVGYSTKVGGVAEQPSRELHCHTMMMTRERWLEFPVAGQPFRGLYSDGYTSSLTLPPGFGIYFEAGEQLDFMPMFNNRDPSKTEASLGVEIHFIRAEEVEGLVPLYSAVAAVDDSKVYMVPPGGNVREKEFRLPYQGEIHAMGVHVHPYGRSVELINLARDSEVVWRAVGALDDQGRLVSMPFYSRRVGYAFGPEDRFLLRATYDNPTDVEQDAMAGIFMFFSTEDGKPPVYQRPADAESLHHH